MPCVSHNPIAMSLVHIGNIFFRGFVLIYILKHVIDTGTSHLFDGDPNVHGHKSINGSVIATTVSKDEQ